jgi:hypothetical protein
MRHAHRGPGRFAFPPPSRQKCGMPERAAMVCRSRRARTFVTQRQMRMPRGGSAAASLPRRVAPMEDAPVRCRRPREVHELRRATIVGRTRRRRDNQRGGSAKIGNEASAAADMRFDKAPHAA